MTEFLAVLGQRLEARFVGPRSASRPTLVFLHEGLGSVSLWRDFPDQVAAATHLPALVYSRLGYGGSDRDRNPKPVGFMHHEAHTVLPALLDAAGISSSILVGHSDGASIALLFASKFPGPRAAGVVALAPHVFVEDLTVSSIAKAADTFRTTDLRARLARYHATDVDGAFWGWNRIWLDPEFRRWNIEAEVAQVVAPVLLVQGEGDEYGTRAQVDTIARLVKGKPEVVMLPHCGHSPHRDQPEETLRVTAGFVRGLVSPPPSRSLGG